MGICQSGDHQNSQYHEHHKRANSLPAISRLQKYNSLGLHQAQSTDSKRELADQLIVKKKSTLLGNLSLPPQVKIKHHETKEEKEIEMMKKILEL